ncbi:sigma-70 family RNA polymerase sigma factor [Actinomadura sp. ATCC 31491]|uniref:Sigma-70 family RNA polymerase sigma factor n=1 Tax=Actinomadura luzonensis TaxID=2805427 RepID=A0ABT0FUZ2_9ACTN|nr:sigma-70 family RNA polymerase sigma factor [Actinomadura luzonensis]MCK2216154.1 sigma-70 family RNA polymerase sigma factor [Actinomadura luzonensis]
MSEVAEGLLRELAPQVLGVLVRRHGQFDACEDAVQEALLDAAVQWPEQGVPDNPRAWLVTVASRRLIDHVRSEHARRRREEGVAVSAPADALTMPAPGEERAGDRDDTLTLLFLCCHPALSPPSQLALTLRAVGGLTTAQVARAFLAPEATMAQRISRAKQRIKAAGARFAMPPESERDERLRVVLHVLYLIFNEGYTATSGPDLHRAELTGEAIRLARAVRRLLPDDGEVAGLLALMLLTEARRPARTGPDGRLVPLAEQDRGLWDRRLIDEGVELVSKALSTSALGPYQVQAAIAAVHDEAPSAAETDWPQILALYGVLSGLDDNPVVALNHAVAVAMVHGPRAGLDRLDRLAADDRLKGHHRPAAVRAHLLEMAGDPAGAARAYQEAARLTSSLPERDYLEHRAARLS